MPLAEWKLGDGHHPSVHRSVSSRSCHAAGGWEEGKGSVYRNGSSVFEAEPPGTRTGPDGEHSGKCNSIDET